jgi:hypothetical protein
VLKWIARIAAGLIAFVVVALSGWYGAAKLVAAREENNTGILDELSARAKADGLLLGIFNSSPMSFANFQSNVGSLRTSVYGSPTPDGKYLFVNSSEGSVLRGRTGIFRADLGDGPPVGVGLEQTVPLNRRCYLSSDLTKLVTEADFSGPPSIELFSITPPRVHRLPLPEKIRTAKSPSWNESSSKLVVELNGAIYVYDLTTESVTFLVSGTDPAWSPRGDWIAYRSPQDEAMLIRAGGGESRILMDGKRVAYGFSWSPDGQYLAFTRKLPIVFPLDSPAYLGIYRLRDGAQCIAVEHGFKGMPHTQSYAWLYAPEFVKEVNRPETQP